MKNVSTILSNEQIYKIAELCKIFEIQRYINGSNKKEEELLKEEKETATKTEKQKINEKLDSLKEANVSKFVQYMLICGYMRWRRNPNLYKKEIEKSKKELNEIIIKKIKEYKLESEKTIADSENIIKETKKL